MVSQRGDLSPAGCRSSFFGNSNLKNGGGGGTKGFTGKGVLVLGFLPRRQYIGEGGPRGATQGSQEGARRAPPRGRARDPSGSLVVAPVFSLGFFGVFGHADFLYIFYGISWAL